ncbi:hypothetical protein ACLK17_23930 [Escherichia coli]
MINSEQRLSEQFENLANRILSTAIAGLISKTVKSGTACLVAAT